MSKENYKEILPAPLLSRFTLKCFFENPTNNEKTEFIDKRIKKLIDKYNKEIKTPKINIQSIKDNLDYEIINKVHDFRVINRIITNALIKAINDKN